MCLSHETALKVASRLHLSTHEHRAGPHTTTHYSHFAKMKAGPVVADKLILSAQTNVQRMHQPMFQTMTACGRPIPSQRFDQSPSDSNPAVHHTLVGLG